MWRVSARVPGFIRGQGKILISHTKYILIVYGRKYKATFLYSARENGSIYWIHSDIIYRESETGRDRDRETEKRSESLHIVIIVISAFLIYMIYSNKMFLIKNGNMLAIISFKSDHLRISGQSVKSILKVKVLEK